MALTLEDKLEIQQLYAEYNHAIDSGRGADWAATFIPDGVFSSTGAGTFTGTDALTTFGSAFANNVKGGRHWTNNLVINGAGESATGTCYLALLVVGAGKPVSFLTTGIYNDELVKTSSGWRFKSRAVTPDA